MPAAALHFSEDLMHDSTLAFYNTIPVTLRDGIVSYIRTGRPTGDCLKALITNNLSAFIARADPETLSAIKALLILVYMVFPSCSHGSPQAYEDWIDVGGWYGKFGQRYGPPEIDELNWIPPHNPEE
jgi:hypothetical protein